MGWLLLALLVAVLVGWGISFARPHTAVRLEGGRATLVRGRPPAGLVGDLDDLARGMPEARVEVALSGGGDALHIAISGVDAPGEQRIRNVVRMYAARIRS